MAESKINKTDDLTAVKKFNALNAYVGFSNNDPVILFKNASGTQFTLRFVSTGILTKDGAGQSITFTASCYFGRIAIMTRDPLGEWRTYLINGTQV